MSVSAATVLMPDSEPAWKIWRSFAASKGESLESPSDVREGSRPVVVGLPATACRSIGLVLPAAEPSLLPSMIEAQLEKRGITVETAPSPNFAWHLLGQDATRSIVSVDVLAQPFPENLAVKHAANYTAALRMMTLPPREMVVIEEQGLLVLASNAQGKLWQSYVLGTAETAPQDFARELEIAKLSLEATDGFGTVHGVTLVGPRLAPLAAELKKFTTLPVETVVELEPNRTLKLDSFKRLLPASVFAAQAARAGRRKMVNIIALAALAYAVIIAIGWWRLGSLEKRERNLQAEVDETDAPAAALRETQKRWQALAPAIDVQRYPMVQLSEITAILPPSGIVIKRFEAKPTEIEISGDARDAQTFTTLKDELNHHKTLGNFAWSGPVPSMKDKVASFKLQGKLITK